LKTDAAAKIGFHGSEGKVLLDAGTANPEGNVFISVHFLKGSLFIWMIDADWVLISCECFCSPAGFPLALS
jgi:hypothetical protein